MLARARVATSLLGQTRAWSISLNVTDTEMTVWGIGITQNIDAAATELYLNYRHFCADITCSSGNGCLNGSADRDFDAVIGGARMKF